MSKIRIQFNKQMREKVALNLKQSTTRKYRAGKIGDNFFIGMTEFILLDVMETKLAIVARDFYAEEGFSWPQEFVKFWMQIYHLKDWNPDETVYIHWFAELPKRGVKQES